MEPPTYSTRSAKRKATQEIDILEQPPIKFSKSNSPDLPNENVSLPQAAPTSRGTAGAGRGRGRGGRGSRGGRGAKSNVPSSNEISNVVKTRAPPASAGRGRGGRVKKSDDSNLQSLYHRKAELKKHFKKLVGFQREALDDLAYMSGNKLLEDPNYHKSLPEFEKVSNGLDERRQKALDAIDARLEMEEDLVARKRKQDEEYAEILYQCKMQDVKDRFIARTSQLGNGQAIYGTEWDLAQEDYMAGQPFVKVVPPSSTPSQIAEMAQVSKAEYEAEERAKKAAQAETAKKGKGKPAPKPTEAPRKTSLYQPGPSLLTIPTDSNGMSVAPTPTGSPDDEGSDTEVLETATSDELKDFTFDKYGLCITNYPRKKNGEEANNRLVIPNVIGFEDIEIGVSRALHRNVGGIPKYIGSEHHFKTKTIHLDRFVEGYDYSDLKPEDFDQEIVKRYNLHPLGIAIPGKNVDYPHGDNFFEHDEEGRVNWDRLLPITKPVEVIVDVPGVPLDQKLRYSLSRSAEYLLPADKGDVQARMKAILRKLAEEENPEPEEAPLEARKVSDDLLRAAASAQEALRPTTPPPPKAVREKTTPKSTHYDPVRDITNHRGSSPPRPPPPSIPQVNPLSALADAADMTSRRQTRSRRRAQAPPSLSSSRPERNMGSSRRGQASMQQPPIQPRHYQEYGPPPPSMHAPSEMFGPPSSMHMQHPPPPPLQMPLIGTPAADNYRYAYPSSAPYPPPPSYAQPPPPPQFQQQQQQAEGRYREILPAPPGPRPPRGNTWMPPHQGPPFNNR